MSARESIDRTIFPVDEWALRETEYSAALEGRTETIFAVANGYLGMRANPEEGHGGHENGTFINGFHDTWPIRHAEEAYGFARVGQTIVNVPDTKLIRLYVDDVPFIISEAELFRYERRLDFRDGVLVREVGWRTPSGKRVQITSRRMASFSDRHVAVVDYEVTVLDAPASVVISSQILNRQDWVDEFAASSPSDGGIEDPRRAAAFNDRVLLPRVSWSAGGRYILGYRAAHSGMTLACAADHAIHTRNDWSESSQIDEDLAKHVYTVHARPGEPIRVVKTVTYHTSQGTPARELADRCHRTLDRIAQAPIEAVFTRQREWLSDFWARCDIEVPGQSDIQQAIRWNLFQLAQSTARTDGGGIAAKGVSGSGYSGHYFWDSEIYVLPFLTYTAPEVARNALRFRLGMLDKARERAAELNQHGALFPWRTINGLEASAYYAAGTAQYHIDADVSHALTQYLLATSDHEFLVQSIDILVETARMWADLGFWRGQRDNRSFHIHGVTGPDEYTTVVNDNLFTNVMARANLRSAIRRCTWLREKDPDAYARMVARVNLRDDELTEWSEAAESMHILFDEELGIHPQDADFLEKELWDLENTPESKRPLLLHFHPLVIYRFQVIKQADVVLALLLQGDEFTPEEKRKNFEYYDALTTGDSTLSASTQSIVAAEVGYRELALKYFHDALFVDLGDLHHNTADGIHVASTGGVWSALAFGFGGMRDYLGEVSFDPRLPEEWDSLTFPISFQGSRVRVELREETMTFTVETGDGFPVTVRGKLVTLVPGPPVTVPLRDEPPSIEGAPTTSDIEGTVRSDGSVITASMPTITASIPTISLDTSGNPIIPD